MVIMLDDFGGHKITRVVYGNSTTTVVVASTLSTTAILMCVVHSLFGESYLQVAFYNNFIHGCLGRISVLTAYGMCLG